MTWTEWEKQVLEWWRKERIFEQSIELRKKQGAKHFVFYEGPPSANGRPGIHHVLSRTLKDHICRFKTMRGYVVERVGGWDTHGLPVELEVEKKLGIHRYDVGKKISIEEFNRHCRQEVLKYKQAWEELTERMAFWIDLKNAYITFDPGYIESLWWAIKQLYKKGLLYRGYTIQPYSPAAGTALSSHELNLPGCYREVDDPSVSVLFADKDEPSLYYLAWTTTPWTLPANVALAVGPDIEYVEVETVHPHHHERIRVVLARTRLHAYFNPEMEGFPPTSYKGELTSLPWRVIRCFSGRELANRRYHQLIPFAEVDNPNAFRIYTADFVSTEEGTGIVHIAPAHGEDDFQLAQRVGLPMVLVVDEQGRFTEVVKPWQGRPVKDFYDEGGKPVDEDITEWLRQEGKLFYAGTYRHNYPHCWRTDKPIIYYPIRSWFIRVSAFREKLVELNRQIQWQPPSIGEGRFGNWLATAADWNLSRTRFWGTPLPIWATKDESEIKCIGSFSELREEVKRAVEAGVMKQELPDLFDPHRPYVDEIVLVSSRGEPMYRYAEVIDVWFDSGGMPFAQFHYPFENREKFAGHFPAHFIAEGVDQTRGWFYTLHVLASLLFDSPAFKSVIVNGLVLDRHGRKMSKRLGNVIEPMELFDRYGADAVRWYMLSVNNPWENMRFDTQGVAEVLRKFFRALHSTYTFFAMYANVDGYRHQEKPVPPQQRPLLDKWILSRLQTLIKQVTDDYENYEPTRVTRHLQHFVVEELSNWYVRLSRRRFWKGEYDTAKISGYQTLYTCLETVAKLMAPIAPFYADFLYKNLTAPLNGKQPPSVHLCDFPCPDEGLIDRQLEEIMDFARRAAHLALSLRKEYNIKVRQPLQKMLIVKPEHLPSEWLQQVGELIRTEVNVKQIIEVIDSAQFVRRTARPNYRRLGPRFGPRTPTIAEAIKQLPQEQLAELERTGNITIKVCGENIVLSGEEVEVVSEQVEGWLSRREGAVTVALDITITDELRYEGMARELVNRIQNLRKESGLEITERIVLEVEHTPLTTELFKRHGKYIADETLTIETRMVKNPEHNWHKLDVFGEEVKVRIFKATATTAGKS